MLKKPMTTEELSNKIRGILKDKDKLSEILDYGLATSNPIPIRTYEFNLKSNLAYGGNEGIYLDFWIEYFANKEMFEAILEERKIYEKNRSRRRARFWDSDYICCSSSGRPHSKDFHWKHYKALLKSDFNPKAVSKLMGHAKELITVDVYGDKRNIIPEEIPELISYMDDVMPKKKKEQDLKECVLDAGIKIEGYLPRKGKPE